MYNYRMQNLLVRIVSAQLPAGFSKRQFSCDSPNKNWQEINELRWFHLQRRGIIKFHKLHVTYEKCSQKRGHHAHGWLLQKLCNQQGKKKALIGLIY